MVVVSLVDNPAKVTKVITLVKTTNLFFVVMCICMHGAGPCTACHSYKYHHHVSSVGFMFAVLYAGFYLKHYRYGISQADETSGEETHTHQ